MFCFLRMFERHTIGVDFVKCRTTKWFSIFHLLARMKLFFKISAIPNIYETRYFKAYQHESEGPNQSQSNWSKAVEILSKWIHQTSKNVWAKKSGSFGFIISQSMYLIEKKSLSMTILVRNLVKSQHVTCTGVHFSFQNWQGNGRFVKVGKFQNQFFLPLLSSL